MHDPDRFKPDSKEVVRLARDHLFLELSVSLRGRGHARLLVMQYAAANECGKTRHTHARITRACVAAAASHFCLLIWLSCVCLNVNHASSDSGLCYLRVIRR